MEENIKQDTYNSNTKKMNVGVSNASWSSTEKEEKTIFLRKNGTRIHKTSFKSTCIMVKLNKRALPLHNRCTDKGPWHVLTTVKKETWNNSKIMFNAWRFLIYYDFAYVSCILISQLKRQQIQCTRHVLVW